jgi:hypothetical protein
MAKTKGSAGAVTLTIENDFWKPEKQGETVSGTFLGFGQNTYGFLIHVQDKATGQAVNVPGSTVVARCIQSVAEKFKVGKTVLTFEYTGMAKKAKLFNVTMDGKKLSSGFSVPDAETAKALIAKAAEGYAGRKKTKK